MLARLLDGPRAQGAFLLRSVFEPPWSLRRPRVVRLLPPAASGAAGTHRGDPPPTEQVTPR